MQMIFVASWPGESGRRSEATAEDMCALRKGNRRPKATQSKKRRAKRRLEKRTKLPSRPFAIKQLKTFPVNKDQNGEYALVFELQMHQTHLSVKYRVVTNAKMSYENLRPGQTGRKSVQV